MIHEKLLLILSLLFVVFLLVMLGEKLRISYPIFLVISGLVISLIPGIPSINLDPELVFIIFLPPLLYEAAWYTSWNDFWKWRRPISVLAFGLVIFTSGIVAVVASSMIPGFTLALGFLLGGIISPPDAVAATSVLKGVRAPKRVLTILEGESLVNDASSLIVFRFALAAVMSGTFVLQQAAADFFIVTFMGVVTGLIIAHIMYAIHRWMPTNASIDTALTLMTPYLMYIAAEEFHYSGVMAVVSGGLFLSFRSHEILNFRSRIQASSVWSTVIFMLNGIVFILIGLELPVIVNALGEYSMMQAIWYALIITALTIVIRILWVFPTSYIPRWLSPRIRNSEPSPGWRGIFLIGWAGMRGVVSLASALSIPLTLAGGEAFPQRNLILFITFVVILVTLVLQGLSLPFLIKWLKIEETQDFIPEEEQETAIRLHMMQAALKRLDEKYVPEQRENELVDNMKKQLQSNISLFNQKLESLECDETETNERALYNRVLKDIISVQRKELQRLRKQRLFEDDVLRRQEARLDLDEAKISYNTR